MYAIACDSSYLTGNGIGNTHVVGKLKRVRKLDGLCHIIPFVTGK